MKCLDPGSGTGQLGTAGQPRDSRRSPNRGAREKRANMDNAIRSLRHPVRPIERRDGRCLRVVIAGSTRVEQSLSTPEVPRRRARNRATHSSPNPGRDHQLAQCSSRAASAQLNTRAPFQGLLQAPQHQRELRRLLSTAGWRCQAALLRQPLLYEARPERPPRPGPYSGTRLRPTGELASTSAGRTDTPLRTANH